MSDNGRRIFPMETVMDVLLGNDTSEGLDFLGYVIDRPLCDCARGVVTPMVKGWLCSLNPAFVNIAYDESLGYPMWLQNQKKVLGDNVSVSPLPEKERMSIHTILDNLKAAHDTAEEKTAEAEAAQAELKALSPFKKKAEDAEKKIAQLDEKNKALTEQVASLKKEVAAFTGKVAINTSDIEQTIKDMVAKSVKDALATLPIAAAGVAVAVAATDAAPEATATDSAGDVPDTFGFGASAPSSDGFGF